MRSGKLVLLALVICICAYVGAEASGNNGKVELKRFGHNIVKGVQVMISGVAKTLGVEADKKDSGKRLLVTEPPKGHEKIDVKYVKA